MRNRDFDVLALREYFLRGYSSSPFHLKPQKGKRNFVKNIYFLGDKFNKKLIKYYSVWNTFGRYIPYEKIMNKSKLVPNNIDYNRYNKNINFQIRKEKYMINNLKWISWAETGEIDPFIYYLEKNLVPDVLEGCIEKFDFTKKEFFLNQYNKPINTYSSSKDKIYIYVIKNNLDYIKFYFVENTKCMYYYLYSTEHEKLEKLETKILSNIEQFLLPIEKESNVNTHIIKKTGFSYDLRKAEFNSDVNLNKNYGNNFTEIHNTIKDKIDSKSKGLYLFHGSPGTGKTNYIRHLSTLFGDKKFIFIPPCLSTAIDSPEFIGFLDNHRKSVLIFEDAENIIESRESNRDNFRVSSILNLADGIVSDLLKMHIIITFNTDKEKIDEALLRKGRLSYIYEFDKLSIEDSNKFLENSDIQVDKPHSLAELYNIEEETGFKEKEKGKIGF